MRVSQGSRRLAGLILFTQILCPAAAQDPVATPPTAVGHEWIGGRPFWEWQRCTGDWDGLRTSLERSGIEVGGGWTMDWSAPWRGGLRSRDTARSLLDVNMTFDLEKLLGLPRTNLFVDAYSIVGRQGTDDVGDAQGFSNIDAPNGEEVAELWLESWLLRDRLRVKIGKVDANSEFAFLDEGGEFLQSSAGFTPAIHVMPTFPDPAMSINVFVYPTGDLYVGAGVYDGAGNDGIRTGRLGPKNFFDDDESDDHFAILEVGRTWGGAGTWGAGRLAVGAWHHTGDFGRFDGGNESGTEGFYVTFDQRVWREKPGDRDDAQGLAVTFSYGIADQKVAEIGAHTLFGLVYTGLIDDRDDDVLGLLYTQADMSDVDSAGFPKDESVFELFYKLQLTPAVSLKPDLQYIVNPAGSTADEVLVATLRLEVRF